MSSLIGILLVLIAGGTIVSVLYLVMQEKHEHEEHFIPPETPASSNDDE
jgi:hypothetical protein